jgi:DNA mismatch repair ATPase MutS
LERESFTAPRLRELRAVLDAAGEPPSQRIARLGNLIDQLDARRNPMFAPFAYLLMWGTQLAYAIEAWRAGSGQSIAAWLAVVGEFEALCSLAAYAYEEPADPFPEVTAGAACYDGEGLRHPLLRDCVPNDLRLDAGGLRVLVVSGSNMSGKSTYLRTAGVNAVLALAGAPVRARRLRLSPLAVGTSMHVHDSLEEGRSRFYAEVLRVRQLVDLSRGPLPLLFLLDEIFAGTNSHDRRIGAESVVRGLVAAGALGLVTTHDLSLTQIADQLGPRSANVHFADHFEDGVMRFDYRLQPGVVRHSNALALMRAVGLEV